LTTAFPTSIDNLSNPDPTDPISVDHAQQHSNANDAIEALETKIGVNGSAVTTTHDYKLSGVTGTDKAVSKTGGETLTNKTLTSPTITNKTSTGTDNGTETLVNKTLTSPIINGGIFTGGGALLSKTITATRDISAVDGDVAYTGVGFTPTSIQCVANIGTTDRWCSCFASSDKTSYGIKKYTDTTVNASAHLLELFVDGSNYVTGTLKSYDADGFTITWSKASSPTGTATMQFLCFK
jgi:hypothetical protein